MAKPTSIKEAIAKWEEKAGEKAGEAKIVKLYAQYPPIEKMDASLSLLAGCEKLSLSTNCIEKIANLNGLKFIKILSLGRNNIKNLSGLEAVGDTLEELWISYNNIEKLKGIHVLKKLRVLYMSNNLVKDWGLSTHGYLQVPVLSRTLNRRGQASELPSHLATTFVVQVEAGLGLTSKATAELVDRLRNPPCEMAALLLLGGGGCDPVEFVRLAELPALADLVFVGNPLEEKHSAEGNWMEEATRRLPRLKKLDGSPVIRQDEDEAEAEG